MAELETTFLRYAALPVELQGLVYEACDIETRIRFNMAVRALNQHHNPHMPVKISRKPS